MSLVVGVLAFPVLLRGLDHLLPLDEAGFQRRGISPEVVASDGTRMRVGLTREGDRLLWRPLDEISPHLVHAVIAAEDQRFWDHAGVDPCAVVRACLANLGAGRGVEGASTLTMQLARLVDPQPRTLGGKLVQAFRAWQIEQRHDKRFVLEHYLNLVPFGGNLRGAAAAAHAFFGKEARDLTPQESALLASLLPAPTRRDPFRDPAAARARRDRVLDRMQDAGLLDRATWQDARASPLALAAHAFPDVAPHAWLRAGAGATSIDPSLQRAVESLARQATGVDGLAVVVVENETRAVRALVGARRPSPRVLDASIRPRSAGSTLKPLLYALAFDLGLACPSTRLLDLPWATQDWAPRNFDETWQGPVPAGEALERSLNVPAVRLAASLPPSALLLMLRRAGFAHLRPEVGGRAVDLAIGTDDVTAMELAGAYAALADEGRYRRPWLAEAERPAGEAERLCSPGAAELVLAALSNPLRARPAGAPAQGVAWKTGTSSDRRDAWAVGVTRRVTVVAWRGRLDGRPDPTLVGAEATTPLLFAALAAADREPAPFPPWRAVRTVQVCAETGYAATPSCPERRPGLAPSDASPLRACDLHQEVELDAATGEIVCRHCAHGRRIDRRVLTLPSPALAAWWRRTGHPTYIVPPHAPECPVRLEPAALEPVFASPPDGLVARAEGARARIPVTVLDADATARLKLLVDGVVHGELAVGVGQVLELGPGRHVLLALSPRGHTARVEVVVCGEHGVLRASHAMR